MLNYKTLNEIFYAIFGRIFFGKFFIGKMYFFNEGVPTKVGFDYQKVIKKIENGGKLIGFYHTHPYMDAYMSRTDVNTMKSWVHCEGKTLYCIIKGNNGTWIYECFNYVQFKEEYFGYDVLSGKCFVLGNYIFGIL